MFKRLLWLLIGASIGFGCSLWLMRALKQTIERYKPERVTAGATSAVKGLGAELKAALGEGRAAMQEREAELKAELQPRL